MVEKDELDEFVASFPKEEVPEQKTGFTPLTEGLYAVSVADIRYKKHKRGPMYGIRLNVSEGPSKGRVVWANIIFLPWFADANKEKVTPGAGIARGFLKAIGQPYKGENIKVIPKAWMNQSLGVRVIVKKGNNDVKSFFSGSEFQKALEKSTTVDSLKEEEIF